METAVIVTLAMACGGAAAQGMLGGTLHAATLRDWNTASASNQMATVTEIVERVLKLHDPLGVAPKARGVRACINRVSSNFKLGSQTVTDTAVACMAELGYLPR